MASEKPTNEYELDLKQYSNHRRVFPWMLVIKVILGLGIIVLIYYLTQTIIERKVEQVAQPEYGVEVSVD